VATGLFAFTTTHRVIDWVLGCVSGSRALTIPTASAGFPAKEQCVI
jgi:hypothetical protein